MAKKVKKSARKISPTKTVNKSSSKKMNFSDWLKEDLKRTTQKEYRWLLWLVGVLAILGILLVLSMFR